MNNKPSLAPSTLPLGESQSREETLPALESNTSPLPLSLQLRFKRKQGWVSGNRKPLFWLGAPVLASYVLFIRDPLPMSTMTAAFMQLAGTLLIFAGCLGRLFSTVTIGGHKNKSVVRTELYSICRNPLYFSSFLLACGLGLLTGRLDFAALVAAAYLAIFVPMMKEEARHLRSKLPEYPSYERSVPLFFPKPGLWIARDHFEINFRLVGKTCLDALIVVILVPLVIIAREFILS